MGEAPRKFCYILQVKAFEKIVIGPFTLGRTWGTRPAWLGNEISLNKCLSGSKASAVFLLIHESNICGAR
jgi:hypothetical protein